MLMLPKEHGAYGQLAFPLVTALAVSGASIPAVLIALAVVGCFLAHEPLLVLLGLRGARARREQGKLAGVWLSALGVGTGSAAALALVWLPASGRWALLVPLIPAIPLTMAIVAGKEKTWPAEVGASLVFSAAAFPVAMAAGATIPTGATVATVFALNFVLATLAVRVVILKIRGGGDPAAVTSTRRAALALACVVPMAIVIACLEGLLPWTAPAATVPGVVTAIRLAVSPPPASRLRTLGWALVTTSATTAVILIAGLRLL
jgi:hypothetical protein